MSDEPQIESALVEEAQSAEVFSLKRRRKLDPVEVKKIAGDQTEQKASEVDPELVRMLETFLEQAKKGVINGLCCLSWNKKFGTFDRVIYLGADAENVICNAHLYMGGLKYMADDISGHVHMLTEPEEFDDDGDFE